jgi:hypothetical protein
MAVSRAHVAFELLKQERIFARDPAMTALLDHLAEELARDYVRMTEKAASDERIDGEMLRDRR